VIHTAAAAERLNLRGDEAAGSVKGRSHASSDNADAVLFVDIEAKPGSTNSANLVASDKDEAEEHPASENRSAGWKGHENYFLLVVCVFLAVPLTFYLFKAPLPLTVLATYVALYMSWAMLTFATRGGKHNSAILVLGATILKLSLSLMLWRLWEGSSWSELPVQLRKHRATLSQYVIPAGLYAAGDILRVDALRQTDAGTFAVLFNSRILFLAVVWQWVMGRKLLAIHWVSLLGILFGCCLKEYPHVHMGFEDSRRNWAYLEIVTLGCLTAAAAVWNEMLLQHRSEAGVSLQNLAMYSWGIFWTGLIALVWSITHPAHGVSPFTAGAWLAIFSDTLVLAQMILLACYGICTAYFLRYLSNIAREVALGAFVVFSVIMDMIIFGRHLVIIEYVGVSLVVGCIILFIWKPVLAAPKASESAKGEQKDSIAEKKAASA
jgi:drug/metabolite transporter (DMT)-like permease